MDIKDKKVIVTGGVKGIGNSIVEQLIKDGAVVGVFDTDEEGLENLKKYHKSIYTIKCDVTDYNQVELSIEKFYQEFKKIDILINNAGILYSAPLIKISATGLEKHDITMWNKVIACDLTSVFYMTVCVVEKMVAARTRGVIVNISSVSASGNVGQSAYSAAKAGVNALTAVWAKELSLMGIRVVGVAPGYTDTDSTKKALSDSVLQEIVKKVPLRRLGRPEEIADGVISIIENDFFNGKVFELDGGLVI